MSVQRLRGQEPFLQKYRAAKPNTKRAAREENSQRSVQGSLTLIPSLAPMLVPGESGAGRGRGLPEPQFESKWLSYVPPYS